MTLGDRIKELRLEKNYSQEYLAEVLGLSRQAVYKWEKNISRPDTSHLIKLAEILGSSVDYLANGKPEDNMSQSSKQKKSIIFKVSVILISAVFILSVSFVSFIVTRPVSFDAGACSGGFETHIWNKYKNELLAKYNSGFDNNNTRVLIEKSQNVIYKDKTIVFFFDVEVTDENGNTWIDYVHITGKRIWTEKYVIGNCVVSEKLSPEEYFDVNG